MKLINKITHVATAFLMIAVVLIFGGMVIAGGLTLIAITKLFAAGGLAFSAIRYYAWSMANLVRSEFQYPPNRHFSIGLRIALVGLIITIMGIMI